MEMTDLLNQLSAEEKLLLSLCRLEFTNEQKEEISILMKEITDWDHFVNLSNKHGIIALCWYNLTETGNSHLMPARHLDLMHSAYLKSLTRNIFLYNQFEEVASLAKRENIKIVLLKGMALEKTVYGNKGLRQMNDIDILVRQDQAALLRRILLNNGYESAPLVSYFHEKILPAYGKHLPEMYKNDVAVEIHFKLFDQKGNSLTEEFFNKALTDNDSNVCFPDLQLLFLYLVKHLDKHEKKGSSQLRLYTDLVLLHSLFSDKILNEKLLEYVLTTNLEEAVSEKITLLEKCWRLAVPEYFNPLLIKSDREASQAKFAGYLNHPNKNLDPEQENLFYLLKEVPGLINRLLLLTGHAFPSIAYMKYRYKSKTRIGAILFYPVRWAKQVAKITGLII
jgi:hypothetical protein